MKKRNEKEGMRKRRNERLKFFGGKDAKRMESEKNNRRENGRMKRGWNDRMKRERMDGKKEEINVREKETKNRCCY